MAKLKLEDIGKILLIADWHPQELKKFLAGSPDSINQIIEYVRELKNDDPEAYQDLIHALRNPQYPKLLQNVLNENQAFINKLIREASTHPAFKRFHQRYHDHQFATQLAKLEPLIRLVLQDYSALKISLPQSEWAFLESFQEQLKTYKRLQVPSRQEIILRILRTLPENLSLLRHFSKEHSKLRAYLETHLEKLLYLAQVIQTSLLHPDNPANPFITKGGSRKAAAVIYEIFTSTQALSDTELEERLKLNLLSLLSPDSLLTLQSFTCKLVSGDLNIQRFYVCLNAQLAYLHLHPQHKANAFIKSGLSPQKAEIIYQLYQNQGNEQQAPTEERLYALDLDSLLSIKTVAAKLKNSLPQLEQFLQSLLTKVDSRIAIICQNELAPQVLTQMADHLEKIILPQLKDDIEQMKKRAKPSLFKLPANVKIAEDKLQVLRTLYTDLTIQKNNIRNDASALKSSNYSGPQQCVQKHREECNKHINTALQKSAVYTHCNVLKSLVIGIRKVIQQTKTSLDNFFNEVPTNKPKDNSALPQTDFFKTKTQQKLDVLNETLLPEPDRHWLKAERAMG